MHTKTGNTPNDRSPSPAEARATPDDLSNLYAMYQTVVGGGVAPVNFEDAKRLESFGFVVLGPAHDDDRVPGEIEPQYTFTLTSQGEAAANEYRASWRVVA